MTQLQISWRTGVNMREFAFYGTPACPHTDPGLQRRQLDALRGLKNHLVRFYAPYSGVTAQESLRRVIAALDLLQEYGMAAVICLNDSLHSAFIVPGDAPYHNGPLGHIEKRYWHEKRYRENLIPFATTLTAACAGHPAAFLWELGNEYAIHPQPASRADSLAFLDFAKELSEVIKKNAPGHLVSTGLVGSHHVSPAGDTTQFPRELYSLPTLDAISIHYYADDDERPKADMDAALAKALSKPYYIGEFGAPDHWPDRAAYYRDQMAEWMARGAFTAMPWAFDTSPMDVGVSDNKAFAAIHPAFAAIGAEFASFARPVSPVVRVIPASTTLITPMSTTTTTNPTGTTTMTTPATPPTKTFIVTDGPLSVRTAPTLAPGSRISGRILVNDQRVEVDPKSRTEAEGYVWWRHAGGWSAERSINGVEINMIELIPPKTDPQPPATTVPHTPQTTTPIGNPRPTQPQATVFAPQQTKIFQVVTSALSIRTAPTLEPRTIVAGKMWKNGDSVVVDAQSRTEAEGFVWWRHAEGWSAEKSLTNTAQVLMVDAASAPKPGETPIYFSRLPVDLNVMRWFYYYGNTRFAFKHGREKNYDGYSQGLHGGIDFGHPGGAQVVAGIRADVGARCTYVGDQRSFRPNRLDITVGPYTFIFGHLASPNFGLMGQLVGPDTVLGVVDSGEVHMHLEVRRAGTTIVNPLLFFPRNLVDAIIARFPPQGDEFGFQPFNGQWETPLDQPEIKIGGRVIGPRA